MPHVGTTSGGDDLASSDEIKVFEDEGDDEDEKRDSAENLTDLKSHLVAEGEQERKASGKPLDALPSHSHSAPSFGYIVPPYPHHPHPHHHHPHHPHLTNGSLGPISMGNKVSMVGGPHPGSPISFMMHNLGEGFPQPPPAHMGNMGVHIDPKTGIPRTGAPMYPLTAPGQYSHPVFPDFAQQLQVSWHTPGMYSSAFRGPYPPSLPGGGFHRFSAPSSLIPPYPGLPVHPGHLLAGQKHHDLAAAVAASVGVGGGLNQSHHESNSLSSRASLPTYSPHGPLSGSGSNSIDQKPPPLSRLSNGSSGTGGTRSPSGTSSSANHSISSPGTPDYNKAKNGSNNNISAINKSHSHVKKPLNAFMLYMKEMRTSVVSEYTLKESAAINQILGKKWHNLSREEQAKYYEMARKERQLHMQLYPGWTARDNYAVNQKKKKKKRDKSSDGEGGSLKKCRARFGLDQQSSWCKPCRRKKKCIRYLDSADTTNESEGDNLGSVGSVEAPTPDSKSANESDPDNLNLSSAELSLSSPPVPSSDYMLPHHLNHHNFSNHRMGPHISSHNELNAPRSHSSSSSLASLSCPPRNSPIGPNNPLSIEQLTRPHCPPLRSSLTPSSLHSSIITSNCIISTSASSATTTASSSEPIPIPQMPTPPSTDSSSAAAPQMLIVA